jgi:hypothetical protein
MKKINLFFLIFCSILLFNGCDKIDEYTSSDIDESKIEERLKNLSTLGTVECSFTKTIKSSDEQFYTIGSRQILMSCKAYVKAGVNFEKISITKMDKKNKSIEFILPKAEVILLNIPAEEIKVELETTGMFRSKFSNDEIQKIQVLAEKDIQEKIKELDILSKAESNATIFLDKWVRTFGFNSVKISYKQ